MFDLEFFMFLIIYINCYQHCSLFGSLINMVVFSLTQLIFFILKRPLFVIYIDVFFKFYLFIWLLWVLVVAYGIQLPDQGWNPGPLHWELRVLATGPPEKSLFVVYILMKISLSIWKLEQLFAKAFLLNLVLIIVS